ncbi:MULTISPECIES: CGNR zinc finger domain-containing protein [Pseudonocardia]|uniref:Putative stress-induced transcription regulator n=1 Tax=Pseudonocardia oroxyli TaxID=366584 RepID=A0A1G7QJK6_PSEOR|nr:MULTISPECIES: CGNR zinc finger domain-containing protein [Pseudonocardia]SDF98682.1 Putative stress-induced transcription regulator [Pseudonocardia oroxyli]
MDFIGYRSDALGAAVALVNTVTAAKAGDVPAPDQLRQVLVEHGYLAGRAPASAEPALRGWAGRLRTVFDAEDLDTAAAAVNALLSDVEIGPHLTRHDGQGWHLHYSPPDAAVLDRVRSTTAFALAMLVSEYGLDRHGRCAADGCERVFADTSRNAARRYCSPACANRSAVAAHRARQRAR